MKEADRKLLGRGATYNPANRYEKLHVELELSNDFVDEEKPRLKTQFFKDTSKTIVTENKSPDIGFTYSINPYRGCEHGCAYCYARPSHEYLGFSAGLDFESKIFVKPEAAKLLREKLMSPKWEPHQIFMSGITDCYQPIERQLRLTRGCLEVLAEFRNPVGLITKNHLITRDIDIFQELNRFNGVTAMISMTSLDDSLCADLEPRTSRPKARLQAIEALAKSGIPVGVNVAPIIPGLNDHEIPAILKAAAGAGAQMAGFTPVRLPLTVLPVFTKWLEIHRPLRKDKVLSAIRDIRGGKLNDPRFGSRMRGEGALAENLAKMFRIYSKKYNLNEKRFEVSTEHFRRPPASGDQLSLIPED